MPASAPLPGYSVTIDIPPQSAKALLRRMALDVPRDLFATLNPDLAGIRFDAPVAAAPPFEGLSRSGSPNDASRAIDCLTAAVYYEARSQSDDGQRAVAQVVLNRVRDRAFPASVCGVVYQGAHRASGCQFSFTCDGSMTGRRDPASWAHAQQIATDALSGTVYAPVGSATFYHANYVQPWWAASMDRIATVGAHIFYRWRGRLEGALAFRQAYAGIEPSLTGRTTPAATIPAAAGYATTETTGGVRIHRGTLAATSASAPVTAIAASDAPARQHVIRASVSMMGGVRIHRGAMPAVAADSVQGGDTLD